MHKYFIFVIISSLLSGCSPKDLPTIFENRQTSVKVQLSHMSSRAEMETIRNSLAKRDIFLDFSSSSFFESGNLRILKLKLMLPSGVSGQTAADLVTLQYHYVGFSVDENASPPFFIGQFPPAE